MLDYTILNHTGYESFEDKLKELKIAKPYDKIFKTIFKQNPNGFLIVLKIQAEFKEFKDSEIINYFYQELHADIVIKTYKKGIYIIEFQSTKITLDDLTRFGQYMASLVHKHKTDVHLYVISIANEKRKTIPKSFGDFRFTIHIISLTRFDSKKAINMIKNKIESKEEFKEEDIVLLELIPFMTKKKKKRRKLLKIAAELTNELDGVIESKKLIEIKSTQFVLACTILNDKEKEKIARVITMETIEKKEVFQGYLTKEEKEKIKEEGKIEGIKEGKIEGIKEGKIEGIKEGIKEGKIEGIKEGKEEIVKNLIKLGASEELITKATNMSKAQIATLTTTII